MTARPPLPPSGATTDDLDAPMTREEAAARLEAFAAVLADDPEDGTALAGWMTANYYANLEAE